MVGLDQSPLSAADIVGDITDTALLKRALLGADAVVHTAAFHAPHVGIIPDTRFEEVNVQATHDLARLAVQAGVTRFVFTSTTALYGSAATPGQRAGWVDESLAPQPGTIYHRTKLAAEALLEILATRTALTVTALRMSRCFPEPAPVMAVYRLHRGVDARDVAEAHALALGSASGGFRKFVISGATPFRVEDVDELACDAPTVLKRRAPELVESFVRRGWRLPGAIDRVYSPMLAMRELGWRPRHDFREVLNMLDEGSSEVLPPRNH